MTKWQRKAKAVVSEFPDEPGSDTHSLCAAPLFMGGCQIRTEPRVFDLITHRDILACNQNPVCGTLCFFILAALLNGTVAAAPVSWENVRAAADSPDVDTNGASLLATYWSGSSSSHTINGVSFTDSGTKTTTQNGVTATLGGSSWGLSGGAFYNGTLPVSGPDGVNYAAILGSGVWGGNAGASITLTLSGLTVGRHYRAQFWVFDDRWIKNYTETITSVESDTNVPTMARLNGIDGTVNAVGGTFVIGSFTADSSLQTFTVKDTTPGGSGAQLNGFQLRDVTGLQVAPSSPTSPVRAFGTAGTAGSAFSYRISCFSNGTNYGATGLPPGLSLDANTGLISGTPKDPGFYHATIHATSGGVTYAATLIFLLKPQPGDPELLTSVPRGDAKLGIGSDHLAPANGSVATSARNSAATVTFQPALDLSLLINPGKGYVEYNGPTSAYTRDIIGIGYSRCDWSVLEPSEGVYNWARLDNLIAAYARYGRKIAFRVMNSDAGVGVQYATPKWVFDAGAVPLVVPDSTSPTRTHIIPSNWEDPVYLAKMKDFLAAFGARYNGNPNIAYLDMGNYGNWGEGNGSFWPGTKNVTSSQLQNDFYQPYFTAFPDTQLMINGMDWLFRSVFSWGVSQGAGRRTDGICAGNSNGSQCLICYPLHPAVMEYWGMSTSVYRGGAENELMIYLAGGRPTYLQFNGDRLYNSDKTFYQMVGNLLGYHFVLQQATMPKTIRSGVPFSLSLTWLNDGVAPLYEPCSVAVALLDANNNVVQRQWLSTSNPHHWMPGVRTTETFSNLSFPVVPNGYRLAVGLFLKDNDTNPTFRLGIQGRTEQGWYVINDTGA